MHILIIDDSSSTRSLLRTLINSQHSVRHKISEAASGDAAFEKIEAGEMEVPDIAIVDLNMSGMSGYDVVREFRSRYPGDPAERPYIIIITANEGIEVINTAMDAGANDYITKPVHGKTLQVRLRLGERKLGYVAPTAAEDPRAALASWAVEFLDLPVAVIETIGAEPRCTIAYANAAMAELTQLSVDELEGQSLSLLEGWAPEFITTARQAFAANEAWMRVPLQSLTDRQIDLTLDFVPVRYGSEPVVYYMVLHHAST